MGISCIFNIDIDNLRVWNISEAEIPFGKRQLPLMKGGLMRIAIPMAQEQVLCKMMETMGKPATDSNGVTEDGWFEFNDWTEMKELFILMKCLKNSNLPMVLHLALKRRNSYGMGMCE